MRSCVAVCARVCLCFVILGVLAGSAAAQGEAPLPVAAAFSPPVGFRDELAYRPRLLHINGVLLENTDYGIKNPDLIKLTCFGQPWETIYHAGEDLYREDGYSTAGSEVTAVAAGRVAYANPFMNYPGRVIILEHLLPSGQRIYSMYGHLDDNTIEVAGGEIVERGQRLGTVLYQRYTGRYPQYHLSGDDSHLHFEMRYFLDASQIYRAYPACNGIVPGRGYTYPEHPDDFPLPGAGYTDPSTFVETHVQTPTSSPTLTWTPQPTATATAPAIATRTSTPTSTSIATRTATRTPTPRPAQSATPSVVFKLRLPLLLADGTRL